MNLIGETELNPWLILLSDGDSTSLAMWRIAGSSTEQDTSSLAIFSDRAQATQYAQQYCSPVAQVMQFQELQLIRIMASCYEHGVQYAALNPTNSTTRQLFALREVLSSAKQRLKSERNPQTP